METKCSKHPHYKINKKPKHQCTECMSLYLRFKGTRKPTAKGGKVILSKKDLKKFGHTKHKKKEF
jgi:hypothetical protein